MDFLNKAFGQVSALVTTMTPAARLTSGLLVAVIGISLIFLVRQQTDNKGEYLFGVLTDGEITRMTSAFADKDLDDWKTEGNRIRVPRAKRYKYMSAVLEANAQPESPGSAWADVFNGASPIESRNMQELRMRVALQKDLAFALREISGIEAAAVKIQEVKTGTSWPRNFKLRAGVSVTASGNRALDADQVKMIREFVAAGGGVKPEDVVITDTIGRRTYTGPPSDGSVSAEHNAYVDTQRRIEQEHKAKIMDRLSMYPGATVEVYVELDQTLGDYERVVKLDEKPVVLRSRSETTDSSSSSSPVEGRPGAEPNGVGLKSVSVSSAPKTDDTLTETVDERDSLPSVTETIVTKPGLVAKLVSVSIGIPRSYFKQVWQEENPTPPGEDPKTPELAELEAIESTVIQDIETAIVGLIPKAPPGEDTFPRVKVVPYTDIPLADVALPSMAQTATSWFASNWQTLAMLGVGLFGLLFLRSMIQSAQNSALNSTATERLDAHRIASLGIDEEDDEGVSTELGNSLSFNSGGRSLGDELTELVRDDPDAAASIIQNWITEAA